MNDPAAARGGAGGTFVGGDGVSGGAGGMFVAGTGAVCCADGIDAGTVAGGAGAGFAGGFGGDVSVTGTLYAGTKDFRIDHPLDPANKYLLHASVESAEMMNIYTGNVVLDENGAATVQLPAWFQALNGDFRYQLTAVGRPSPGLYVAQEVTGNQFQIAGGSPGAKVSWQITGVRQDAFAKANPLVVEQPKSDRERGYYIHPALYGAPEDKDIGWAHNPSWMKLRRAAREKSMARAKNASQ